MVHTFTLNGYHFSVDGNSGNIHLLDDLSFHILDGKQEVLGHEEAIALLKDRYCETDITEAYNEIQQLIKEDLIFTSDQSIEDVINHWERDNSIKALCLHVAHDCNLRCEYCFADEGDYSTGRSLMNREVALKSVDYLVANSGKRRNIEIDFFGGEPLMNFDVVKAVVAYGREIERKTNKQFYFTMTTNGTLLDEENIEFINANMDNIVISIDGRKRIHDAVRHDVNGGGSYDRIVPLAKKLVDGRKGKSYFIRGTFTSKNIDFSNDVFHLADLGFKEISVEPVVGIGKEFFITDSDVPNILEEYERFALQYLQRMLDGKPFRFYHFNLDLYGGPCLYKRIVACGAGFEYLAVSPTGDIYPCHQFVGEKDFKMGNVYDGITNHEVSSRFRENNIATKKECRECWAKLFCSGGCHANAWFTNGNIKEPNEISCILQKKRIECAIMVQHLLNGTDSEEPVNHI